MDLGDLATGSHMASVGGNGGLGGGRRWRWERTERTGGKTVLREGR